MDLYPVKAQFLSGEEVELRLDTDGHICEYAEVSIYHLNDLVYRQKVADFTGNILISVGKYDTTFAGYGASVRYAQVTHVFFWKQLLMLSKTPNGLSATAF